MFEGIAAIILAIGTAYNYFVTAKVRVKTNNYEERIIALEKALLVEKETVNRLKQEIDRLTKLLDKYREELDKKDSIINKMKQPNEE